ncbi:hypothetical protein CR513_20383, partial [Mucuna pruriens]
MIVVLPLKPLEPPYPRSYDPNAKCDFHARADLIDGGWLKFKENELNMNNNPLPAHGGQSINALSHKPLDLESNGTEESLAHSAQVAVLGQDRDYPPKPFIIRYDLVHRS